MTYRVEADERWGESCLAYNLQADLDEPAQCAIAAVQSSLAALLGAPLRQTPASTMHVSIFALVYVHWQSADKEAYWTSISQRALTLLREQCAELGSFRLRFTRMRVAERAVIALAEQPCATIEALREQLARALAEPHAPRPRYDIVHTTLARFGASAELARATVARVEALPLDVELAVRTLRVMRERSYPSLAWDEVARFSLRDV